MKWAMNFRKLRQPNLDSNTLENMITARDLWWSKMTSWIRMKRVRMTMMKMSMIQSHWKKAFGTSLINGSIAFSLLESSEFSFMSRCLWTFSRCFCTQWTNHAKLEIRKTSSVIQMQSNKRSTGPFRKRLTWFNLRHFWLASFSLLGNQDTKTSTFARWTATRLLFISSFIGSFGQPWSSYTSQWPSLSLPFTLLAWPGNSSSCLLRLLKMEKKLTKELKKLMKIQKSMFGIEWWIILYLVFGTFYNFKTFNIYY